MELWVPEDIKYTTSLFLSPGASCFNAPVAIVVQHLTPPCSPILDVKLDFFFLFISAFVPFCWTFLQPSKSKHHLRSAFGHAVVILRNGQNLQFISFVILALHCSVYPSTQPFSVFGPFAATLLLLPW